MLYDLSLSLLIFVMGLLMAFFSGNEVAESLPRPNRFNNKHGESFVTESLLFV
jgi:hypothetical protein